MAASPFGINVVSSRHLVVCRACNSSSRRVSETCPSCGTPLADTGFAIVEADGRAARPRWGRLQLRRATAA